MKPTHQQAARRLAPRAVASLLTASLALALFHYAKDASPAALVRSSLSFTALVLMSFVGWGSAAAYAVARRHPADLGLRAAWGIGISLATGGLAVLLGVASRPLLAVHVTAGLVFLAAHAFLEEQPVSRAKRALAELREHPWFFCGLLAVAAMLFLHSVCAVYGKSEWAVADDGPAYTVFPKQILESGTFDQPFSFRRLSTYGGQSFLQALFLLELRPERLYLFDRSVCTAVVLLLVLGTPRRRLEVPRELLLLPLLLVASVENVRANLASEMSGAVLILGLYRTLRWEPVERGDRALGSAALVALLGAGAISLRENYAPPVVTMLVLYYAAPLFAAPREAVRDRARLLREPALAMALSFLFLLPWALAAQRSCHSFAYPFVSGNYHKGAGFEFERKTLTALFLLWDNAAYAHPVASIHAFLFAGLLLVEGAARRPAKALLVGSFAGFFLLILLAWPAYPNDYARYYFGFEIAFVCAVSIAAFEQPADGGRRLTWSAAVVVVASLMQLQGAVKPIRDELAPEFDQLLPEAQTARSAEERVGEDLYAKLQAKVPPGATILALVDEPYRLDFSRNRIDILDFPGIVSPGGAMPTHDATALGAYLHKLGIRYLAYIRERGSKHLYKRSTWEAHAHGWEGTPQHTMAKTVLDALGEIDELASKSEHLLVEGDLVLVDLDGKSNPRGP